MSSDGLSYFDFNGPQKIDKAVHTLEGLIKGIAIDGKITQKENYATQKWFAGHNDIVNCPPFTEIMPVLQEALKDGVLDDEEKADLIWLCRNFSTKNVYFCTVTADLQRLQGVMGGILADGIIEEKELEKLTEWLDEHVHLKGAWPYDEIGSLIAAVLEDGTIDEKEHEILKAFFKDFIRMGKGHSESELKIDDLTIHGVCAHNPKIEWIGKTFGYTGLSKRIYQNEFKKLIELQGGHYQREIDHTLDYLIVGKEGNPCWAFSRYGRSIEKAVALRKEGNRMLIVNEDDFWNKFEQVS